MTARIRLLDVGWSCLYVALAAASLPAQTFVDRQSPGDLRLLTYNVFFDHMFPDQSLADADKFARIVSAVAPDIINVQEVYSHSAADAVQLLNTIAPLGGGATWHAWQGFDNIIISKYPLELRRTRPSPAGERDLAMALVDLPAADFHRDLYIMNTHYKCCGGGDPQRQRQSDALVNWVRDARQRGESIDLPGLTPMMVLGDLNIVETQTPLETLLTGNIADEGTYGSDAPPDWDGSHWADANPLHNTAGPADYTWRDDSSPFGPGILDFVLYSDHVTQLTYSYVLNTVDMSSSELAETGLDSLDVVLDPAAGRYDHLPLVTDFRWVAIEQLADLDNDGALDADDLNTLQLQIQGNADQLRFDFSGDAQLDQLDYASWLYDIFGTLPGDANLDRSVDGQDLLIWNAHRLQSEFLWSHGDFNFDGVVDALDFQIWSNHKFTSAQPPAVPEPGMIWLSLVFTPVLLRGRVC